MKIFIVQMYEFVINEKRVLGERCLKAWLLKLHYITEPTAMREREQFKLVAQVSTYFLCSLELDALQYKRSVMIAVPSDTVIRRNSSVDVFLMLFVW